MLVDALFSDVNECVTIQPCMNGGRCFNLFGTYACECVTGWMGKNCDKGEYMYLNRPLGYKTFFMLNSTVRFEPHRRHCFVSLS